ncbi:MAG: hypothetical protein LCH30_06750 [Proteobacteria bacterium]|nr:hypothetical protein [Pseudomonadota bacterium]
MLIGKIDKLAGEDQVGGRLHYEFNEIMPIELEEIVSVIANKLQDNLKEYAEDFID